MTTTELDIIIDNASETAFPFLNQLSGADDKELMIELSNEFGYSDMICARIIDSWRETITSNDITSRKKIINTFVEKVL